MLGWYISISINTGKKEEGLAFVKGSVSACRWIDEMVSSGAASQESGGGYPSLYSTTLGKLRPVLRELPSRKDELFFDIRVFLSDRKIEKMPDDCRVSIECWDQS